MFGRSCAFHHSHFPTRTLDTRVADGGWCKYRLDRPVRVTSLESQPRHLAWPGYRGWSQQDSSDLIAREFVEFFPIVDSACVARGLSNCSRQLDSSGSTTPPSPLLCTATTTNAVRPTPAMMPSEPSLVFSSRENGLFEPLKVHETGWSPSNEEVTVAMNLELNGAWVASKTAAGGQRWDTSKVKFPRRVSFLCSMTSVVC